MRMTFSPKTAHAIGRQITADDLANEPTLAAQWPGIAAGDYVVEYSSRPGVPVHEKQTQFENAWESASTAIDELAGRIDAIEEKLKQ